MIISERNEIEMRIIMKNEAMIEQQDIIEEWMVWT